MVKCLGNPSGEPDRTVLNQYINKEILHDKQIFVCTICGKSNGQKTNVVNHVESVHFPTMFVYLCKFCGKSQNNRNSLYVHISNNHRDKK